MNLDPLHPAAYLINLARSEGVAVQRLLAFTRRSTVITVGNEQTPDVIKLFFGSDHVLDALPDPLKPSAYGFYWYSSKSFTERNFERDAVDSEIAITTAMSGETGWPTVLGAGTLGGIRYMRLAWIPGSTLQFQPTDKVHSTHSLVRVLVSVADALALFHAAGYVHRDLYQENILVDGEQATIIDLGAAKLISDCLGPSTKGPEPHWAPEYLTHFDTVDASADIYSFGVLLHRALTGDIPRACTPTLIQQRGDTLLAELLLSCINSRPEERPQAEEIAGVLRSWLTLSNLE